MRGGSHTPNDCARGLLLGIVGILFFLEWCPVFATCLGELSFIVAKTLKAQNFYRKFSDGIPRHADLFVSAVFLLGFAG